MLLRSFLLGSVTLALACAELETVHDPRLETRGAHSVVVGETVQLSATTLNGRDASYVFESADAAIASVDAAGVVTGVSPGETAILVTGASSKARAVHAIVVVAPPLTPPDFSDIPAYDDWMLSAHADASAEAFSRWNDEGAVPVECARCHSSEGFVDYLGGDGTAAGSVEAPAPTGSVVRCETCHDPAAQALASVTFPSGESVHELGPEARCMTCHQGRASGDDVSAQIAAAGVSSDDEVSSALHFENVHYYPAAATLYAGQARGGFQYPGQVYDVRFRHVSRFDSCTECHDPHTTKVRFDECVTCHPSASDVNGARGIRMIASRNQDYDGDGDTSEGIYGELVGLRGVLLSVIQRYGVEKNTPVCFGAGYPYWFVDANRDGTCQPDETARFTGWTARLVRATYNLQLASTDPGNFAHNAKYIIQLLHDSVMDVNGALVAPLDVGRLVRNDVGHFNGASEAARHWDEDDEVEASCSRCHSGAQGFRFFVSYGVGQVVPETDNGLECSTCHESFEDTYELLTVTKTLFPGNKSLALPGEDNLCSNCHSGRESKSTLDAQIATGTYRFRNVHYLPAAATREGTNAKVGYEYTGKVYAARLEHLGGVQCTSCHDPAMSNHTFRIADVWEARCDLCHADYDAAEDVRLVRTADYDGDGDTSETLKAELEGLAAHLLSAMRAASGSPPICYSESAYPYFFKDSNGDGSCTETSSSNGFAPWTAALMKAAHNYQLSRKDPGAWAHNFDYVAQLLIDSIQDLGGPLAGLVRP